MSLSSPARILNSCLSAPLRYSWEFHPLRHRVRCSRRSFHTTYCFFDNIAANPYDVLGVSSSATPADIKKQFYHLSKTYHPDLNPTNQEEASRKFVGISDAYRIIGDPVKREKFDREHERQRGPNSNLSASSTPYTAGARKASGLSRRRTHFRGPPPSFYRNGAWGAPNAKRTASGGTDGHEADARRYEQKPSNGGYGGTTGSWPFNTDPNDVPHFDREGHYRTTSSVEEQLKQGRLKRRRVFQQAEEDTIGDDTPGNILGRFFMVGAALMVGVGAPIFIFSGGQNRGIG